MPEMDKKSAPLTSLDFLTPTPAGPSAASMPVSALDAKGNSEAGNAPHPTCREAELMQENLRLHHLLRQAQAIIDIQQKMTGLLPGLKKSPPSQ